MSFLVLHYDIDLQWASLLWLFTKLYFFQSFWELYALNIFLRFHRTALKRIWRKHSFAEEEITDYNAWDISMNTNTSELLTFFWKYQMQIAPQRKVDLIKHFKGSFPAAVD